MSVSIHLSCFILVPLFFFTDTAPTELYTLSLHDALPISSSELFDALYEIRGLNVIGCDLVEVCPAAEHGFVTPILGAKVIREMLLAYGFPQGAARGESV